MMARPTAVTQLASSGASTMGSVTALRAATMSESVADCSVAHAASMQLGVTYAHRCSALHRDASGHSFTMAMALAANTPA